MSGDRIQKFSWLVYGGCAGSLAFGGIAFFLTFIAGSNAMLVGENKGTTPILYLLWILCIGCFLSFVGGMISGIMSDRNADSGSIQSALRARVLAKFASDRSGTMMTDPGDIEAMDNPQYYVRLDIDGRQDEYRVAEEIFWQIGEGMWGDVLLKGRWIGGFVPHINRADATEDRSVWRPLD